MNSPRNTFGLIFLVASFLFLQSAYSLEFGQAEQKVNAKVSNSELSYYAEVNKDIMKNWSYGSGNIDASQDLYAIVVIKIKSDGEISGFHFDKKSGDVSFDSSVEKAVQLSNPLSPFPDEIKKESMELGLRFKPNSL